MTLAAVTGANTEGSTSAARPGVPAVSLSGSGTRLRAPSAQALPARIGSYTPISVLGAGGMGQVFLAESERGVGAQRLVAVKVLHEYLATKSSHVEMFVREAELGAELEHPGICRVLEFGNDGRAWYMAQELLHGRSLKQVYAATALSERSPEHLALLASWFVDLCDALHALHDAQDVSGVPLHCVHRDISPDNLFVTFDGFTKLLDLGLVKLPGRSEATEQGILKGKLSYIAPELLEGAPPSRQSDVWALGVCLWELCTGRRLFDAATDAQVFRALSSQTILPPSSYVPGLPAGLDQAVSRALSRDPARRFESADAFGAALSEALQELPPVRRATTRERLAGWFPGEREQLRTVRQNRPSRSGVAVSPPREAEQKQPDAAVVAAPSTVPEAAKASSPFWTRWFPSLHRSA